MVGACASFFERMLWYHVGAEVGKGDKKCPSPLHVHERACSWGFGRGWKGGNFVWETECGGGERGARGMEWGGAFGGGGRGRPRSQVILVQGCGIGRGVRRVRARGLQRGQGWCRPGCPISVNLGLLHPRIRGTEHHGRPTKTRVHGHDPRPREDSLFRVFRVFRGSNPWPPSSTSHGFPSPTRGGTPPPQPRMQFVNGSVFVEPRNTRNTRKPGPTSPRQGMPHRAFRVRTFQG